MKQLYTFILFSLSLFVGAQELLTNGDFETGDTTGWTGNAAQVRTENGNSFNFAEVATAGNPYDVNLSQGVALTQDVTYTLSFDASTDETTGTRTIIAGIGLSVEPYTNKTETVTITSTTQTFTYNLKANFTGSTTTSRVLFDMGAAAGIVVIDNVSLQVNNTPPAEPEPTTTSNTTPTAAAGDVISIFSDNYTNITMPDADWSQATKSIIQIDGRNILKLESSNFYALQDLNNGVDFSMMDKLHIDYWTGSSETASDGGVVKLFVKLVDLDSAEGGTKELLIDLGVMSNNTWNTVTIDLNSIENVNFSLADVNQIMFDNTNEGQTYYLDNWYFEKTDNNTLNIADFSDNSFSVYPNPVQNTLFVNAGATVDNVSIFDLTGRQVLRAMPNAESFSLDVSNLNKGMYLVSLKAGDQEMTAKLVK